MDPAFLLLALLLTFEGASGAPVPPLAPAKRSTTTEDSLTGAIINDLEASKYLADYGYLKNSETNSANGGEGLRESLAEDWLEMAVREFQRFMGLEVTGRLDRRTSELMRRSRCGNRDIAAAQATSGRQVDVAAADDEEALTTEPTSEDLNQEDEVEEETTEGKRRRRYALAGSRWPKDLITYRLLNHSASPRAKRHDQEADLDRAFQLWASVTSLRFEKRHSGPADIEVRFVLDKHDGCREALSGQSNQLAHAFQPGKRNQAGDIHFNDHFRWLAGSQVGNGERFLPVAIHEIGHSLGLDHSHSARAIMFPINLGHTNLTQDDKRAIQILYGPSVTLSSQRAADCSPIDGGCDYDLGPLLSGTGEEEAEWSTSTSKKKAK